MFPPKLSSHRGGHTQFQLGLVGLSQVDGRHAAALLRVLRAAHQHAPKILSTLAARRNTKKQQQKQQQQKKKTPLEHDASEPQ
jgi:hypothetical protein